MISIDVAGVTKRYGELVAVDDVSFTVDGGEIFVLLGPNGAGKTTTVEIAEGLRRPDGGEVRVLGYPPASRAVAPRIGVMPQRGDLYSGIRTEEALRLFASFYDEPEDTAHLMSRLDLERVRRTTYRRLSGGEKRRLSLALAIVGRPEVAFLDEPTAELDIEGRAATWDLVRELRSRGVAVVVTTHQLEEAEKVADRVAIMDRGRIVAIGSPAELSGDAPPEIRFTVRGPIDEAALSVALGATVSASGGNSYRIRGRSIDPHLVARLASWLAERGALVVRIDAGTRSLEDTYLDLTR